MSSAGDRIDRLQLPSPCSCSVASCARTPSEMMRLRRACLNTTYRVNKITVVNRGSGYIAGQYIQLNDGGNPAGLLRVDVSGSVVANKFRLVNAPVYTKPPSTPVTSTATTGAGATFAISVAKIDCCGC